MRKIIFTFLLACFGLITNAQIKKGSTLLGGQISFSNSKMENENYPGESKYGVTSISVGRAIKENTVVGIGFGYSWHSNYYWYDSSTNSTHEYHYGAYLRKYKNLAREFYFFGQVDGGFTSGSGKTVFPNSAENIHSTIFRGGAWVGLGLAYNVFKKVQVELSLPNIIGAQYSVTKQETNDPTENSSLKQFSFNSNLTNNNFLGYLSLGFRFIL